MFSTRHPRVQTTSGQPRPPPRLPIREPNRHPPNSTGTREPNRHPRAILSPHLPIQPADGSQTRPGLPIRLSCQTSGMHLWQLRELGNRLNGSTLLGLAIARLGGANMKRGPRGMFVAEGYRLPFPLAGAFTVGDVVITPTDAPTLTGRHREMLAHEEAHAWQWFALLGLPFLPAYLLAMGWSMLRTGDRASANLFETLAGLERGGYRTRD